MKEADEQRNGLELVGQMGRVNWHKEPRILHYPHIVFTQRSVLDRPLFRICRTGHLKYAMWHLQLK
jgi:hypothetical protein